MKYTDIVALVNEKLDGDRVTESRLLKYIDEVVDDINDALSAKFPTFTEAKILPGYDGTYTLFPDMYIRTVVVVGAAYKFYTTEAEGDGVAGSYGGLYNASLFTMKRDYLESVPEIFQNLNAGILNVQNRYVSSSSFDVSQAFPDIASTDITVLYAEIASLKARVTALEAE